MFLFIFCFCSQISMSSLPLSPSRTPSDLEVRPAKSEVDFTWRGRQLGPRPHARKFLLITRKIIIPPPDSGDPPDRPPYFAKKHFPLMSGGGIIILHVIRRHFLACGRGPSCRPLHVKSTSDACRSLTTLTRAVDSGEA